MLTARGAAGFGDELVAGDQYLAVAEVVGFARAVEADEIAALLFGALFKDQHLIVGDQYPFPVEIAADSRRRRS